MPILEDRGYFWWNGEHIPSGHFAPDSAVAGTLKIDGEGQARLELDGFLKTARSGITELFDGMSNPKVDGTIQGILKDKSHRVFLADVYKAGGKMSRGVSYQGYSAFDCLVGDLDAAPSVARFEFNTLEFDLKGFEDWIDLGSITFDLKKDRSAFTAAYERRDGRCYDYRDGILSIRYELAGSYYPMAHHKISLNEAAILSLVSPKTLSLDEVHSWYGFLQDFFILLTGSDFRLHRPKISHSNEGKKFTLYSRQWPSVMTAPPKRHECWLTFPMIRNEFGALYSNWLNQREKFGPGFYLFLGTKRASRIYAEHRFVNLIWGLESFHRTRYGEKKNVELTSKIQRIIAAVDNEDRRWLRHRMRNADEPSLSERLFEIISALPTKIEEKELHRFTDSCAAYRNDISHFGGKRTAERYDNFLEVLDLQSDVLLWFYHAAIMQQIGVADSMLKEHLNEGIEGNRLKRTFAHLIKLLQ